MRMHYDDAKGVTRPNGSFRHFGGIASEHRSNNHAVTIDLSFRMATNGVIVNTLVNDEPLITTPCGKFR
jgi:hypothetical protein